MKKGCLLILITLLVSGCVSMEISPKSGPPGTPVYVKCKGVYGDPVAQCLKWDGKEISRPCTSSFMVPSNGEEAKPGKHQVSLVDELDAAEALLLYPLLRWRSGSATFEVTETYSQQK